MSKTDLFKLLVAIMITFILILPEYFKTPKGRTLELSCLEVCLQPNFTSSPSSLRFHFVTFLQSAAETQALVGIIPSHSNFQSFLEVCQDPASWFKICSLCLVCESKGDMASISREQTSKGLIMRGSMEMKASDFYSPCKHLNFTVTTMVEPLEKSNATCALKTHPSESITIDKDSAKEKSVNYSCRIVANSSNCTHVSLHLEIDVKNVACSMKITWYILVILVYIFFIILVIYKVLEGRGRAHQWQSHKCKSASVLLRGSDTEKPRALRVISESKQGLPFARDQEELLPIPELEVTSTVEEQDQYTW